MSELDLSGNSENHFRNVVWQSEDEGAKDLLADGNQYGGITMGRYNLEKKQRPA